MESMLDTMSKQSNEAYEKATKIAQAMWESGQKLSEFQVNALRSYAEMTADQLKLFMSIHDLESLKEFGTSQAGFVSELSKKIFRDTREAFEIGAEVRTAFIQKAEEKPVQSDKPATAK